VRSQEVEVRSQEVQLQKKRDEERIMTMELKSVRLIRNLKLKSDETHIMDL